MSELTAIVFTVTFTVNSISALSAGGFFLVSLQLYANFKRLNGFPYAGLFITQEQSRERNLVLVSFHIFYPLLYCRIEAINWW